MLKIKKNILIATITLVVIVSVVGLLLLLSQRARTATRVSFETVLANVYSAPKDSFPNVPQENLTSLQKDVIRLTKQEYQKKPISFDNNVLKYSQGNKEPWCANFTSWIMKSTGIPFNNPNSGSWRIPGVQTMQEYFYSEGRYMLADAYKPQVGDVAIYEENRSHVNIVIAVNDTMMTTVGGNETGHIRINTQSFVSGTEGLSGFGILKKF